MALMTQQPPGPAPSLADFVPPVGRGRGHSFAGAVASVRGSSRGSASVRGVVATGGSAPVGGVALAGGSASQADSASQESAASQDGSAIAGSPAPAGGSASRGLQAPNPRKRSLDVIQDELDQASTELAEAREVLEERTRRWAALDVEFAQALGVEEQRLKAMKRRRLSDVSSLGPAKAGPVSAGPVNAGSSGSAGSAPRASSSGSSSTFKGSSRPKGKGKGRALPNPRYFAPPAPGLRPKNPYRVVPRLPAGLCSTCGGSGHDTSGCRVRKWAFGNEKVPREMRAVWPCSYCGGKGHTVSVCRVLASLCSCCGLRGHDAKDCNTQTPEEWREHFVKSYKEHVLLRDLKDPLGEPFGFEGLRGAPFALQMEPSD